MTSIMGLPWEARPFSRAPPSGFPPFRFMTSAFLLVVIKMLGFTSRTTRLSTLPDMTCRLISKLRKTAALTPGEIKNLFPSPFSETSFCHARPYLERTWIIYESDCQRFPGSSIPKQHKSRTIPRFFFVSLARTASGITLSSRSVT